MLLNAFLTPACVIFYAPCVISVDFLRLDDSVSSDFRILGQMTSNIVIRYFSSFRCVVVVTENVSGSNEGTTASITAGNTVIYYTHIKKQAENYNITEKIMLQGLDEKCLGIIIQVSDPVQMVSTIAELSRVSGSRANRRFLFLPPDTPSADMHVQYSLSVGEVLIMREMDFFPDLVMARYRTQERIELVTQKFIGENTHKEQVILDIWTKRGHSGSYGFLHSADLYPDKVSNLMGKRLIMATFTYRPYSIIDLEANPPIVDGTESRIALEFCKKLNATFEVSVDAENEWGEIYENFTGNGILGTVAEDRADAGYGAVYLWSHEFQFVDYSFPYIRSGITCVAPRPEPLAGWLTPVLPFTLTCWAAVGVSVVVSTASLFLVTKATERFPGTNLQWGAERYTSVLDCAFFALGLLVLQTPPDERRSTRLVGPNRHVLVWLTVMFLLVTTSYSSGLASVLTVPRFGPPIDTVADLAASNVPWAATHAAWIFSLRESRDPLTLHILSQFRIMKNEELRKRSFMGDTAFSIERLPAGHFAIGDYITEEAAETKLRLMKQDLYFEHVTTIVRKGSPYLTKLNKLIHSLLESGLMLKWEEQVVSAFLPMGVQRAVSRSRKSSSDDRGPTKLQYQHIEGSLYLLCLGLIISTLAFIGELAYNKCRPRISSSK